MTKYQVPMIGGFSSGKDHILLEEKIRNVLMMEEIVYTWTLRMGRVFVVVVFLPEQVGRAIEEIGLKI